jgi:CRISPR-associated endonuclease Cas1
MCLGLMMTEYPWLSVTGFGAHIKSTQKKLVIQKKNTVEEYPLESIKNLLLIGGHTIHSMTVIQLINNGAFISFFEPDGNPIGIIRPFGSRGVVEAYEFQQVIPRQRYAIDIAQGSIKSRLFAIEHLQEMHNIHIFYEGEWDFLAKAKEELAYLIKLDEIRRLHRLTSDMYYEIMSRNLPQELGFRRRTTRLQSDPVNAMLSFGYAMLFGNCCVSIIGARLDPDIGLMNEGKGSLVYDLIEPLKSTMIDPVVFRIARESLTSADFDQTQNRCMLSDDLINKMMGLFHTSIDNKKIDEQVFNLYNSMRNQGEFKVLY